MTGTPKYSIERITLVSGDNSILIPTGVTYAIIVFDPTSTVTKILKGDAADTGVTLIKTAQAVLPVIAGDTIIINASADDLNKYTEIFFF